MVCSATYSGSEFFDAVFRYFREMDLCREHGLSTDLNKWRFSEVGDILKYKKYT